jgi:hypothetical protein
MPDFLRLRRVVLLTAARYARFARCYNQKGRKLLVLPAFAALER